LLAIILSLAAGSTFGQRPPKRVVLDDGELQSTTDLQNGFGEIIVLSIGRTVVPMQGPLRSHAVRGSLTVDRVEYQLRHASIKARSLSFKTSVEQGISYAFVGRFPRNPAFDEHGALKSIILTGKLVRLKSGKEVLRTPLSFRYQYYSD
jgi:hypothetical protein